MRVSCNCMKNCLTIVSILISLGGLCQEKSSIDFIVGKKIFNDNFYSQINSFDNIDIQTPVNFIGVGLNGYFITSMSGPNYPGHMALLYLVPQAISINSEKCSLTGYTFSMSAYGWNLLRDNSKHMIIVSTGINVGNLRINGSGSLQQKNPFFAPMISLCPKFLIYHFSVSMNIQYDYDITNPNWKKTWFGNSNFVHANKLRQSGLTALICLGYVP